MRIVAGTMRGLKLEGGEDRSIRPTADRTREGLFNVLAHNSHFRTGHGACPTGSTVLDLFAGSGALGLEALSRGAGHAVFVDHTPALAQALRSNLRLLTSESGDVICQSVDAFLAQPPAEPFDILFMDPPFRQGWLETLFPLIADQGWVRPRGWVYVEHESEMPPPQVPDGWSLHRQKSAGQVTYCLFRAGESADI